MNTLFIEMPCGIAGDMLMAALIDVGGSVALVQEDLLALGIGPIHITSTIVSVNGISARRIGVAAAHRRFVTEVLPALHE
jgi:uncharacterized protein (DUF111 family)